MPEGVFYRKWYEVKVTTPIVTPSRGVAKKHHLVRPFQVPHLLDLQPIPLLQSRLHQPQRLQDRQAHQAIPPHLQDRQALQLIRSPWIRLQSKWKTCTKIIHLTMKKTLPCIGMGNKTFFLTTRKRLGQFLKISSNCNIIFKNLVKWHTGFLKILSNGNKIFKNSSHGNKIF